MVAGRFKKLERSFFGFRSMMRRTDSVAVAASMRTPLLSSAQKVGVGLRGGAALGRGAWQSRPATADDSAALTAGPLGPTLATASERQPRSDCRGVPAACPASIRTFWDALYRHRAFWAPSSVPGAAFSVPLSSMENSNSMAELPRPRSRPGGGVCRTPRFQPLTQLTKPLQSAHCCAAADTAPG